MIAQLAQLFAPWKSLYGDSKVLPAVVQSVHLIALLFGGGFAVAADRSTLLAKRRSDERRAYQLGELHAVHRPVLIALTFALLSGVAMATADVETFASSPNFWVKLGLVAVLLANGALLTLTEKRLFKAGGTDARLWSRLRFNSVCSLGLWTATLIAGVALTNAA
jgi:hypothetical protein